MAVGQVENYLMQKSTDKVQNSLKLLYGWHQACGISKGDGVLILDEVAEICLVYIRGYKGCVMAV